VEVNDRQFFYARQHVMLRASYRLGVRLSVCPFTPLSCIKTMHVGITKSSLWAVLKTTVSCDKISCHWLRGFASNESVKKSTRKNGCKSPQTLKMARIKKRL